MATLVTVTLKVKDKRWRKMQQQIESAMKSTGGDSPLGAMFRQWGKRYVTFLRRRYDALSHGGSGGAGGGWPPLKMSTILRRRMKGGGRIGQNQVKANERLQKIAGRKAANDNLRQLNIQLAHATVRKRREAIATAIGSVVILRDTGILFNAIDVGAHGNLFRQEPGGIVVGFAGANHGSGKANIAQIASYHDTGGGKLPRRRILVPPDAKTIDGMQSDLRRALEKLGK